MEEITAEIQNILTSLCAKILGFTEKEIREDKNQYAVFHWDDGFLDSHEDSIDWNSGEFKEKEEMESLFWGRNDFNLPLSLVEDGGLEDIAEKDLISFAKKNNFTMKMYGTLLSQDRIEYDSPMIYGRVESGTALLDCFSAALGLNKEILPVDKKYYEIHDDWEAFETSIQNPLLADHFGTFFQSEDSARCFGAYFEKDGCFQFHGFDSIAQWDLGEGQGELHIVRITDFTDTPLPKFSERYKPDNIPDDATWCEEDKEWVKGERDSDGKYNSDMKYWRPDGTLVSTSTLVHGVPTGGYLRFHENGEVSNIGTFVEGKLHGKRTWISCHDATTEKMHAPHMDTSIWRSEIVYDMGTFATMRYFLEDGQEVNASAEPLIKRPAGVPEKALPNSRGWTSGVWDKDGVKEWEHRFYDHFGKILSIDNYKKGDLHGVRKTFRADGTTRTIFHYKKNRLSGPFSIHHSSGDVARKGEIDGGEWKGVLEDFDSAGTLISSYTFNALPEIEIVNELTTEEVDGLLNDGFKFSNPSSSLLAKAIALGWAGDEYRDDVAARKIRGVVKEYAKGNLALGQFLEESGLAYAPRMLVFSRVIHLQNLAESLGVCSKDELSFHLSACDGVGSKSALVSGGASAHRWIDTNLNDDALNIERFGLEIVPDEIERFPNLETLNLDNNNIQSLPNSLCRLPALKVLKLSGNQLADLPSDFCYLQSLFHLHLSANRLEILPKVLLELSHLTSLNLSGNQLSRLPSELGRMESLDSLWLTDNPLQDLGGLSKLSRLKFLHLGNIPWETLPPSLWEMESLETLWISSSTLSDLPEEVGQLKNLKKLMVWYSNLSSLPEALFKMTHLKELRVKNNPLPEGEIERLKLALPDCTIY